MTTERQIEANRQNALSSTGPTTAGGKAVVARNALKHGVFSCEAVILAGDGKEDQEAYAQLLTGLEKDLKPDGQMERLLVEKIAVNYWRLRRLVRYETGEVWEQLDEFMQNAVDSSYDDSHRNYKRRYGETPLMEYYDYGDDVSLGDVEAQVNLLDRLSNSERNWEDDDYFLEFVFREKLRPGEDDKALPRSWRKKARDFLASLSPQQKGRLRRRLLDKEEQIHAEMEEVRHWNQRFEILSRLRGLPNQRDLDKVVKYETSLERSIFRNLSALKSLQERRKGDSNG